MNFESFITGLYLLFVRLCGQQSSKSTETTFQYLIFHQLQRDVCNGKFLAFPYL